MVRELGDCVVEGRAEDDVVDEAVEVVRGILVAGIVRIVVVVVLVLELLDAPTHAAPPHVDPGAQTLHAWPKIHCTAALVQQTAPCV
jgi:hypothetical protein